MESITDLHAVVEFNVDTPEKQLSGTVETWIQKGEDSPGTFRLEVLDMSEPEFIGSTVVSDGENIWVYDSETNKVLIGTLEEAMHMAEESDFFAEKMGDMDNLEAPDFDHPENPEEAIQVLMEYFDVSNKGTETIASDSAFLLEFMPIAEQMPTEFIAVGGLFNLWIDKDRHVPLAFEYTGGTMGEAQVTVNSLELNTGLDKSNFTFEVPAGAESMGFDSILPESLTLEEASEASEHQILAPVELPEGATLVDVLEKEGVIVLRYTWSDGGAFTIAQGPVNVSKELASDAEAVDVRGVSGTLFVDKDGSRVLLIWEENELFYTVAGDLTPEQALLIAESLQ
jgi:outer membrane lipoprotein-sorting protein